MKLHPKIFKNFLPDMICLFWLIGNSVGFNSFVVLEKVIFLEKFTLSDLSVPEGVTKFLAKLGTLVGFII